MKVKAVFALFDFDDDRSMSKDELVRLTFTYFLPRMNQRNLRPFCRRQFYSFRLAILYWRFWTVCRAISST